MFDKKKPEYAAVVLVPENKYCCFGDFPETREAMEMINRFHLHTDTSKKHHVESTDQCVPIRLSIDEDDTVQDWTRFGSPIQEIDFANVIRWWPSDIINNYIRNGNDTMRIVYSDFTIKCKIVFAQKPEQMYWFRDVNLKSLIPTNPVIEDPYKKVSSKNNKYIKQSMTEEKIIMDEETTTKTISEMAAKDDGAAEVKKSAGKKLPKWAKCAIIGVAGAAVMIGIEFWIRAIYKHNGAEIAE